ncbi:hypothetical protein FA09DRAFT_198746 [Tilletiopsis washingtonensis]|uniref:LIM zinc-binding domain-containing protein n=1 Tax=Tilletiopsis washingtonensis TaxID=58919 RepID=A0A316ZEF4_9BASI|nr:hypothetical protein FA09DRAFT_198746 [Tilletiopsis washingtonensis]PWN99919.1 hypothetical protein FA09DRAFT_198746 [Tilletiopsis washingtonensis]
MTAQSARADPWTRRYVSGQLSPTTLSSASPATTTAFKFPTSSLNLPSSISRDLRSASPTRPRPRIPSDASAPVVPSAGGGLQKVVGTLLSPDAQLKAWACAGCSAQFARDATLYPGPPLPGAASTAAPAAAAAPAAVAYYCRPCYATHFSLGTCFGCTRPVLGLTKEEGKLVRAGEAVWHGRCWVCPCGRAEDVLRGMDGMPVCEACFDTPRPRGRPAALDTRGARAASPNKALPAAATPMEVRRMSGASASTRAGMGATIEALSKRFSTSAAGAAPSSAAAPFARTVSRPLSTRIPSSSSSGFGPPLPRSNSSTFHLRDRSSSLSPTRVPASPPKPRPLTAQFTGDRFDLDAFRSALPGSTDASDAASAARLGRRDSRCRSTSPYKMSASRSASSQDVAADAAASESRAQAHAPPSHAPAQPKAASSSPSRPSTATEEDAVRCAHCRGTPWDAAAAGATSVQMIKLRGAFLHAHCFTCAVCRESIDGTRTFVSLDDCDDPAVPGGPIGDLGRFAHPACAPAPRLHPVLRDSESASIKPRSGPTSHVTHQSAPRPSLGPSPQPTAPAHAFVTARRTSASPHATAVPEAPSTGSQSSSRHAPVEPRRFVPSAGAAPPTRSTLNVQASRSAHAGIFSTSSAANAAAPRSASSYAPAGRQLGGQAACAGCARMLTRLEGVPGPRGTSWHRACLRCGGEKKGGVAGKCGKQLDSAAKVDERGQVRCSACAAEKR